MFVFRVETYSGVGPYISRAIDDLPSGSCIQFCNNPDPWSDMGSKFNLKEGYWKCGCMNTEQFFEWFTMSALQELHKRGFVLSVYKVKRPRIGEYQVAYSHRHASLVKRVSLKPFKSKEEIQLAFIDILTEYSSSVAN